MSGVVHDTSGTGSGAIKLMQGAQNCVSFVLALLMLLLKSDRDCRTLTCQPEYSFFASFGCPDALRRAEMAPNLIVAAADLAALMPSFLTMLKP